MKKTSLISGLLLIAIVLTSFIPGQDKWNSFKPEGTNATVLMPGNADKRERMLTTAIGQIKLTLFIYQPKGVNDDNLVYGISYMDYPVDRITSDSVNRLKEFFDNARDGAINAIHGKLLTETEIKYRSYPGREQRVDFENGMAVIKYRHYLVKNRLYTLQVVSPPNNTTNASINKFLDSFKLLD